MKKIANSSICHARLLRLIEVMLMLAVSTVCNSFISSAKAQENCDIALQEAERCYNDGRFSEAIALLSRCLPRGVPQNDRADAYRFLALMYLSQDDLEQARKAVYNMLMLNRKYKIDPEKDPPAFIVLLEKTRPTIPESLSERLFGGFKKWIWVSGGLAVTYVTFSLLNTEKTDADLPEPPSFP